MMGKEGEEEGVEQQQQQQLCPVSQITSFIKVKLLLS